MIGGFLGGEEMVEDYFQEGRNAEGDENKEPSFHASQLTWGNYNAAQGKQNRTETCHIYIYIYNVVSVFMSCHSE